MHVSLALLAAAGAVGFLAMSAGAVAQKKTEYNVALDGTFAPHAMPDLSGGVEGFNVDLANIIGERLGVKMNITAAQWSGLLPAMQAGKYDFIVAPTTITAERAGNMLFTEGYLNTDFLFVVKTGSPKITELEDFKGKVIAVNKGAVYDSWAREMAPTIGWTVQSYGMPFRRDDVATRNMVEEVIECMKLDGTFTEMSLKWFGIAPAPGSAALTVYAGYGQPGIEGYDPTPHVPNCD